MSRTICLLALLSMFACSPPTEVLDAGGDAGSSDAGGNAGGDAGTDAGAQSGVDAGTDAGVDGGTQQPLTITFLATEPDGGTRSVVSLIYSLPFSVRVSGAAPGANVVLVARMQNLRSESTFVAAADGTVHTATQAPSQGSYSGVDPEGPVWSLMPFTSSIGMSFDLAFEAREGGRSANATLMRIGMGVGTTTVNVSSGQVKGTFFKQNAAGTHPAVLVLGGSECDLFTTEFLASWLTTLGVHAFAVDYCNPQRLILRIPVERVQAALDWLAADPSVDPARLAVFGASRGGELALQLAALDPRPVAVVASVPSPYRWGDTGSGLQPAWTLGGTALPIIPDAPSAMATTETLPDGGLGYRYTPMFLSMLTQASPAAVTAATIPLGGAHARLLLVGAGDDGLWPSCRFVSDAWAMLADAGRAGDEQLCLPNAGHLLGPPGWSSAGDYDMYDPGLRASTVFGGTREGRGRANRALDTAWRAFLLRALGAP